jgi:hypothetical protein
MRHKVYAHFLSHPPARDSHNVLSCPYWYGYDNPDKPRPKYIIANSNQHAAWMAGAHTRTIEIREARAAKAKSA